MLGSSPIQSACAGEKRFSSRSIRCYCCCIVGGACAASSTVPVAHGRGRRSNAPLLSGTAWCIMLSDIEMPDMIMAMVMFGVD